MFHYGSLFVLSTENARPEQMHNMIYSLCRGNYAISTCQLKHFGANGYLCNTDSMPDVYNALYNYIQTLILSSKESMQSLIPVLTEYKEAE